MEDLHEYAKSKGGKCLSYLYMNSHTEYLWEDSSGNQWNAGWYRIKAGSWSPFEANIVSKQECEISKYVESLSFVVAVAVCWIIQFDALTISFVSSDTMSEFGYIFTGAIVAGGSKGSIKLFQDWIGFMSNAEEQRQALKNGNDKKS